VSLKILVTGGAGYIGAHTVRLLLEQGHDVTVVDNLPKATGTTCPPAGCMSWILPIPARWRSSCAKSGREAVIHFAAFIAVGESMREPERYFANNVGGSLSLLTAMVQAGVKHVVFSSTAAVYGNPHTSPILETFPIQPVSPYGESKVMVETLLRWFDQIHRLTSVCLRYFNASGADPARRVGRRARARDAPDPAAAARREDGKPITVFGDDYDTPDGTCIRDYIHVNDLAQAHILAVEYLLNGGATDQFNVGTGTAQRAGDDPGGGGSHRQEGPVRVGPRREGDPLSLVAASGKLRTKLGWRRNTRTCGRSSSTRGTSRAVWASGPNNRARALKLVPGSSSMPESTTEFMRAARSIVSSILPCRLEAVNEDTRSVNVGRWISLPVHSTTV
jgi:UDP-glucose 4-epimerase